MKRVVVIEGDGIGAEVIPQAVRAIRAAVPELELIAADMGLECRRRTGSSSSLRGR